MTGISVIGLGAMGGAIARTLLQTGHSVSVWNRSPEKAAPLVAAGAVATGTAAEAIAANPATITCIASHDKTRSLLTEAADALPGKTVIELSTGGAMEAERLSQMLTEAGATWMIAIINAHPSMIGGKDTVLPTVCEAETWQAWSPVVLSLGGASACVGTRGGMLAALFAALFTTRQGFMFGMIYGALACRKAGIPLDVFAAQVPVTMGVLPAYHKYSSETAPTGSHDNPEASMATYAAAFEDALETFRGGGAKADLPQLFSDLAHQGMKAGLQGKALTD